LEDALIDAEIVIEAIHEDLEDKQKLIEREP
jgi:3-hydroxyacyl-CoA dehydrogenase